MHECPQTDLLCFIARGIQLVLRKRHPAALADALRREDFEQVRACFLLLAAFSWVIDIKGYRKWAFPLLVIGMNSIAAYMIAHLFERFITDSFRIHLGQDAFKILGPGLEPFLLGSAVLLVYWLILFWMYRRKLFLRI